MKIKEKLSVSTLEGEKLAEWAARAQGWTKTKGNSKLGEYEWYWNNRIPCIEYRPDINGGQAMDLQEKFMVDVERMFGGYIKAQSMQVIGSLPMTSKNLKPAICRAVVASEYGEYVETEGEQECKP